MRNFGLVAFELTGFTIVAGVHTGILHFFRIECCSARWPCWCSSAARRLDFQDFNALFFCHSLASGIRGRSCISSVVAMYARNLLAKQNRAEKRGFWLRGAALYLTKGSNNNSRIVDEQYQNSRMAMAALVLGVHRHCIALALQAFAWGLAAQYWS